MSPSALPARGRNKRKAGPERPLDPGQAYREILSHDGRAETARLSATMRDAGRSLPFPDPAEGIPRWCNGNTTWNGCDWSCRSRSRSRSLAELLPSPSP